MTIEQQVKDIIEDVLVVESNEVTNEANLVRDLGMDSLDCLKLETALEEEFDIKIEEDAFENIDTVQGVIDYVVNVCEPDH